MITNRAECFLCLILSFALILTASSSPAHSAAAPAPATAPAADPDAKPFKLEELDALVANIALYPDSVLAQVFMGSTYPLEIVQAERWVTENKDLKGDALTAQLEKKDWDPSVKSLVNFPQVLTMMSKQLEWTTKLGDAFIADQAAVMAAVQRLRAKAKDTGNLKDTPEQKIVIEQPTPQTVVVESAPPQIIKIESASPDVVYVPTYSPTVVYGGWPYPAYPPPAPYYPPGYVASNLLSFGAGMAVGAAWGYAWGGCNWHGGDVDIDVDRNTNINNNINRESHRTNIQNRQSNRTANSGNRTANAGNRTGRGNASSFQHDPSHRKGVSYRDPSSARKVNAPSSMDASRARQDYRGRAETGRQDISRGSGDSLRAGQTPSNANRAGSAAGRGNSVSDRSSPARTGGSSGGSAFSGSDRSGSSARSASSRGQSSRSSASPSRSSSGGGGSRSSGGGGSRGGGGGGRGGGGGGRR